MKNKLEKLPKWAIEKFAELEREIVRLKQKTDGFEEIELNNAKEGDIILNTFEGNFLKLPDHSNVKFLSGPGFKNSTTFRFFYDNSNGKDVIQVESAGSIYIQPRSSNMVYIVKN